MATNDIRSDLDQLNALTAAISSNTTTNGSIIDTADYDLGIMFGILATEHTDGTYTLVLEEDDDIGFGSATVVPADYLIGALPSVSAGSPSGPTPLGTVGVFSNKRYLRAAVVSTGVTMGANVSVIMTCKAEFAPVANP